MSDYQVIAGKDIPENVITIQEGEWAGVQYVIQNIKSIDTTSEGNNISFEYDLISELGDRKGEFEMWFHDYIQVFLNEVLKEYVDTDVS